MELSAIGQFQTCPRNVVATARITVAAEITGDPAILQDHTVAPEGADWRTSAGVRIAPGGFVTLDLLSDLALRALVLQADADDEYVIEVSDDAKTFREIWRAPPMVKTGHGMRVRFALVENTRARFVRLSAAGGDGRYSISEFQAYCSVPDTWPPEMMVADDTASAEPPVISLTLGRSNAIKLILALLGAGVWVLRPGRRRDILLVLLGIAGFGAYFNWGKYHFDNRIHYHEFFHYYLGAKYFDENGYTKLYESTLLAESELGYAHEMPHRRARDLAPGLRQNVLIPASLIVDHAAAPMERFNPDRWEEFKRDVAFFRRATGGGAWWKKMLDDHGYNPSPVWTLIGSFIANRVDLDDRAIEILAWIDPLLLVITWIFVWWAFGWRIMCAAILFFGTLQPSLYYWTGGAFLRQMWFAATVIGICLAKRGRPAIAGVALVFSGLLRIFPLVFLLGGNRRLWISAVVTGSILVALTASDWPEFFANTKKHAATPLTNHMGLPTVLGFRPAHSQERMVDETNIDPYLKYREARNATNARMRIPHILLSIVWLILFARMIRRKEPWERIALGAMLPAVFFELTCYYYAFLTPLIFFPNFVAPMLALSAVTHAIAFSSEWFDIIYLWESVAVLATVALLAVRVPK